MGQTWTAFLICGTAIMLAPTACRVTDFLLVRCERLGGREMGFSLDIGISGKGAEQICRISLAQGE
jgi:hypothetical protein